MTGSSLSSMFFDRRVEREDLKFCLKLTKNFERLYIRSACWKVKI
jgi:hypothetical protein